MSNCVFFSIRALSLLKNNKEENTVTYQESPPWLLTMFKTPCVEIILYPEFSRSNRQANKSSRTMDAGNHRLLQTSSQHITFFSRPPKIILYKFSAKIRFVLVPESHVTESTSPSPSPHVSVLLLVTALNPSYAVKHGSPTKHGRGIRRLRVRGQSELYASFCRE